MARFSLSILSLLLLAVLALAGPLDLLVAERPLAKRTIQHAPIKAALEARHKDDVATTSTTDAITVKTVTQTLTVTDYAIKTKTETETVTSIVETTKTKTDATHTYTATVTGTKHVESTITITATDCTATTTATPTASVMRRAHAPKRAVGDGMLYAKEFV